jgi:RNA polymerase sigma-70 factor (ECF subfamily)
MPGRRLPDESSLVRRAVRGDKGAFGEIYEFYAPRLYRFFAAHTADRMDAEDLTEDVFIKLWKALPGYRQRGVPFGGYIFRIARNALTDHYRNSNHRANTLPIDGARHPAEDADPALSVDLDLERQEFRQIMQALRPDYHLVLSLRFISGLSPDETAVVMGRSPGAVRVLQHRALAALREILSDQE